MLDVQVKTEEHTPPRKIAKPALELGEQKSDERRRKIVKTRCDDKSNALDEMKEFMHRDIMKWKRTFYLPLSPYDLNEKLDEQGRTLGDKLMHECLARYRVSGSWKPDNITYHEDVIAGWIVIR